MCSCLSEELRYSPHVVGLKTCDLRILSHNRPNEKPTVVGRRKWSECDGRHGRGAKDQGPGGGQWSGISLTGLKPVFDQHVSLNATLSADGGATNKKK